MVCSRNDDMFQVHRMDIEWEGSGIDTIARKRRNIRVKPVRYLQTSRGRPTSWRLFKGEGSLGWNQRLVLRS